MTQALVAIGFVALIVALFVVVWLVSREQGRDAEKGEQAREISEIKDAQLRVDAPSRGDVLGRLHDHDF